jgi:ribosome maturation factor RimP
MALEKEVFEKVVNLKLAETSLFLVDIEITKRNEVNIFIDGDEGVNLKDCISLTRHIEEEIDREIEDYELTVSSAGVGNPLKLARQYKKNIGRKLSILTVDDKQIEAELKAADDEEIQVYYKVKEKVDNKNKVVEYNEKYQYNQIKEAKVVISFK